MEYLNKAIFLDRDGTINVDVEYLHETDKLRFIDGVPQALAKLKKEGYLLIVISNQSGIGRGYFGHKDVEKLHKYMNVLLERENAGIDAFYYCPHVESDNCECRKPNVALFKRAIVEWGIDVKLSYMVGDKESDILAAKNIGCNYGLLLSGHDISGQLMERYKGHIYQDLLDFTQKLCRL
jgi:D-glycero-D-manno-heptose 1,7-bisphosphate phosphatase